MADREKVIKGLSELEGFLFSEYGKVSANEANIWYDRFLAVNDALALLKEQDAVEPITEHHLFLCPVCKNTLFREQKFCNECGKRIEWESR